MQCRQTLLASFYHPYTSLSSRLLPLDAKSIPVARFARRKRSDSYIIKIQRGVEKDRRTEVGDGFPWKVNSLFHSEYSIVSLSLSLFVTRVQPVLFLVATFLLLCCHCLQLQLAQSSITRWNTSCECIAMFYAKHFRYFITI